MTDNKSTLPSLRNSKKVTVGNEKVNKLLTNFLTSNCTEINELTCVGAKVACDNIGVFQWNPNRKTKFELGRRLEGQREGTSTTSESAKEEKNAEI